MPSSNLSAVDASDTVSRLGKLVGRIALNQNQFNEHWLDQEGWSVVPVESAMHFDDDAALYLSQAIAASRIEACYAVLMEPLKNTPRCLEVSPSKEGLLEFSREYGSFAYIILPLNGAYSILCTHDDYFLVGGPRDFVDTAVGGDHARACARFIEFAHDASWPVELRDYLVGIATKYGGRSSTIA